MLLDEPDRQPASLYTTKLYGVEWMEKRFGRSEHLLEQAQEPLKLLPFVCRIQDGLAECCRIHSETGSSRASDPS